MRHNQAIEFLGYGISVALRAGHAESESDPSVETPQNRLNQGCRDRVCCSTASACTLVVIDFYDFDFR